MTNRQRLWRIFGPVIVACLLVVVVLAIPWHSHHSQRTLQKAAVSISPTVFKNRSIKVQAMSDHKVKYVPFFGSSELRRMDRFHPSVMAARYHNYRPFLFGARGTQSLPQLFNMNMMQAQMKNKKAVFIISPQWFVKQGVLPDAFKYYNGTYANLLWLKQANPKSKYDRYTAKRLVKLLGDNGSVGSYSQKIAAGKPLSKWDRHWINFKLGILRNEDNLFSGLAINSNYQRRIQPRIHQLPKFYNYADLQASASRDARRQTTNNNFHVLNRFYNSRIRQAKGLRNSQKHFSYLRSPEYGDLEVVLNQMAKTHTNVIFMITPVNAWWEKYTGLSMPMYYHTADKIKYQLRSQGFNNILDYSHRGDEPGFMQDTIHIGWKGWVDFDHSVAPFIEHKQPQPHYHMDSAFLSKKWRNLKPTKKNLQNFQQTELNH